MSMKVTVEIDDGRIELVCGSLTWPEMLDALISALQASYGYLSHADIADYVYETFGYELRALDAAAQLEAEKEAEATEAKAKKPTTTKGKKK